MNVCRSLLIKPSDSLETQLATAANSCHVTEALMRWCEQLWLVPRSLLAAAQRKPPPARRTHHTWTRCSPSRLRLPSPGTMELSRSKSSPCSDCSDIRVPWVIRALPTLRSTALRLRSVLFLIQWTCNIHWMVLTISIIMSNKNNSSISVLFSVKLCCVYYILFLNNIIVEW